jgi:hypothetical protein
MDRQMIRKAAQDDGVDIALIKAVNHLGKTGIEVARTLKAAGIKGYPGDDCRGCPVVRWLNELGFYNVEVDQGLVQVGGIYGIREVDESGVDFFRTRQTPGVKEFVGTFDTLFDYPPKGRAPRKAPYFSPDEVESYRGVLSGEWSHTNL